MNVPVLHFVLISGLLDSINPCAIAVLLLFIALLFTLKKSRLIILTTGLLYITAVYLSYFAIGIGLLKVINLFGVPHLISKIGAWIVIVVGLWGLKEYFLPDKFNILSIPISSRQTIAKWATKATYPTAFISGILLGLFEFPCSGAIYLATIGLLNAKETFLKGLVYLLLYNFMFILPLIIILFIASNRLIVEKMINLDESNSSKLRLMTSLIMIGIGVAILIWFV